MTFTIEGPYFEKAYLCEPIIRSLPEWFGLEESILEYITEIDRQPTWLAYEQEQVVGFISIKQHTSYAAELYVIGLLPDTQRKGIGRELVSKSQEWLKENGVEYLQVKCLGPSDNDENYAKTREFYYAMGFRALEEFKQIWDENNPCLIMIKRL